jgi:hypothetical protein
MPAVHICVSGGIDIFFRCGKVSTLIDLDSGHLELIDESSGHLELIEIFKKFNNK